MEQAVITERNRKAAVAAEANRKRSISALTDEASEAKRLKSEHDPSASVASALANFDFTALPHTLVTDLIIANLQILSEQSLAAAIDVRPNISKLNLFINPCFRSINGRMWPYHLYLRDLKRLRLWKLRLPHNL